MTNESIVMWQNICYIFIYFVKIIIGKGLLKAYFFRATWNISVNKLSASGVERWRGQTDNNLPLWISVTLLLWTRWGKQPVPKLPISIKITLFFLYSCSWWASLFPSFDLVVEVFQKIGYRTEPHIYLQMLGIWIEITSISAENNFILKQ